MFDKIFDPTITLIKCVLLMAGIFVTFMIYLAKHKKLPALEKKLNIALACLALTSFGAFYNMGFFHFGGGHLHTHDLYHYYMGSKYFKEVGYLRLYDATVVADSEATNRFKPLSRIRDQTNYEFIPIGTAFNTMPEWRPKFTEERWQEFKEDLLWFQKQPHNVQWWGGIISDFGYNPSPGWTMIAQVVSNIIPTSSPIGMIFLAYMDGLLALFMFYMIYRAFGWQTMWFSMLYWGSTCTFVFSFTGASMLRHDWIVYLVTGICLLKMQKTKSASFFLALSSVLRIFPVLFMVPVGLAFVINWYKNRRIDREAFKLLMCYGVSLFLIIGASVATVPGHFKTWMDFTQKMKVHKESWNTWNWGFIDIFIYEGEVYDQLPPNWKEERKVTLEKMKPVIVTIQILVIGFLALVATRMQKWETITLGGLMCFMLINPTKYYFVHLITLLPLFASRIEEKWRITGLVMLFAFTIFMHFLMSFNATAILLQFVFCVLIFLMYMTWLILIKKEQDRLADV